MHSFGFDLFSEAIVVVSESELQQVQDALVALQVSISCDYFTVSDDTEDCGTADSLRLLAHKIKVCSACTRAHEFISDALYLVKSK